MRPRNPEDNLASSKYSDFELEAEGVPSPPSTFRVEIAPDNQHLRFTFNTLQGLSKNRVRSYRVYFAAGSLVAGDVISAIPPDPLPVGVRKSLSMVESLFAASVLVGSIDASSTGGESTFLNRDYMGIPGYFFGVAVNLMGQESPPSIPASNPSIAFTAAQSAVPPDVTEAQATFKPVFSGDSISLEVVVAARPPANSDSFDGYQIFFQNYRNSDPTFMSYEEGPAFRLPQTMPASGLLTGTFPKSPDTPAVYSTGTVDITQGYNNAYKTAGSDAVWSEGWALSRRVQIIQGSDPTLLRVDLPISSMNLTASPQYIGTPTVIGHGAGDWVTTKGAPYAVYLKGSTGMDGNVVAPHKVRLLFVSLSHAGTHRHDILDANGTPLVPYVEFPWGFTASLGFPLNPTDFEITSSGVTATLSWTVITTGNIDTTIHHFNLYKIRTGTYNSHTVMARPAAPFATVLFDRAANPDGYYGYTDKGFDIVSTSATYDMDSSDPGYYTYWVTSVNLDWLENPGIVTHDFMCMGNTGDETDPSVFRDNKYNRLYNSSFYIDETLASLPAADVPLVTQMNSIYGPVYYTADGQLTYNTWNPNYKVRTTRYYSVTDAGYKGDEDDAFSVWEYYKTASEVIAFRYENDMFNGEVLLDGDTGSNIAAVIQLIDKNKFIAEENLSLGATARWVTHGSGVAIGTFRIGIGLLDTHVGASHPEWAWRWNQEGEYVGASIVSTPKRFSMSTKLPVPNANGYNAEGVYSFVNGSPTGTWVSGDNLSHTSIISMVSGQHITITGDGNPPGTTMLLSANDTNHTITLTTNGIATAGWTGTTGNHAYTLNYEYDKLVVYFGLWAQPNIVHDPVYGMTIAISEVMLNGGKDPLPYDATMCAEDSPGGMGTRPSPEVVPPACVTGDTFIKTSNGSQWAKEIKQGTTVFSWTKHGRFPNKVDKVVHTQTKSLIHLSTNGAHLYCTPTHRIAVRKTTKIAYVKAEALELDDVIVTSDGFTGVDRAVEVKETLHLQAPVDVYDFHLEREPHNYIASGVVCHNKMRHQIP